MSSWESAIIIALRVLRLFCFLFLIFMTGYHGFGVLFFFVFLIVPFDFGCGFGFSWVIRILVGSFLFRSLFLYCCLQHGDCCGRQTTLYLGSGGWLIYFRSCIFFSLVSFISRFSSFLWLCVRVWWNWDGGMGMQEGGCVNVNLFWSYIRMTMVLFIPNTTGQLPFLFRFLCYGLGCAYARTCV